MFSISYYNMSLGAGYWTLSLFTPHPICALPIRIENVQEPKQSRSSPTTDYVVTECQTLVDDMLCLAGKHINGLSYCVGRRKC